MQFVLPKRWAAVAALVWGADSAAWEAALEEWFSFPVRLPFFYREVHLKLALRELPKTITIEPGPAACGWRQVMYAYNMQAELEQRMFLILKKRFHEMSARMRF